MHKFTYSGRVQPDSRIVEIPVTGIIRARHRLEVFTELIFSRRVISGSKPEQRVEPLWARHCEQANVIVIAQTKLWGWWRQCGQQSWG